MRSYGLLLALGWVLAHSATLHGQISEEQELQTTATSTKPPSATAEDLAPVAKLIVEQTNDFRKSQQLGPVSVNSHLTAAAQYFANYMARTDRYGHSADGKRPADRASEQGFEICIISENIAYQYSSAGFGNKELAGKFVEGWKNSPGHRKNMLEPFVVQTGVAVAKSANSDHYYAVQMFGRPKSQSIEFSIKNESDQTIEYTMEDRRFPLPPMATRTHTRCRPPELHVTLGEKGTVETLKPAGGESYRIAVQQGELRVHKQ